MTAPEDAIRARRKLTNKLIAAHEAARLSPFFDPQMKLITGDGSLILGADEVVAAFDAQFRDPTFVAYVRTTEAVTLDDEGARAAESGRWVGTWKDQQQSGTYLAAWRKATGQWVLEQELYITLDHGG
jgi:hypothetical protein